MLQASTAPKWARILHEGVLSLCCSAISNTAAVNPVEGQILLLLWKNRKKPAVFTLFGSLTLSLALVTIMQIELASNLALLGGKEGEKETPTCKQQVLIQYKLVCN